MPPIECPPHAPGNICMDYIDGNKIIRKSRGNYRKNSYDALGWMAGKWFLTSRVIYFIGKQSNFKKVNDNFPIEHIRSINVKHNDFISSKLTLFLKDSSRIELHLKNRRDWINDIAYLIKEAKSERNESFNIEFLINSQAYEKQEGFLNRYGRLLMYSIFIGIFTFLLLSLM